MMQFLRRHFVRIVIGAVLAAAVFSGMCVFAVHQTDQRQQRLGIEIQSLGGNVNSRYSGPKWIPKSFGSKLAIFKRVVAVATYDSEIPVDILRDLGSLTSLDFLVLNGVNVTDADLVHFKRLTGLEVLDLCNTQVTDDGLVNLNGMTKLKRVHFSRTEVTAEGRAMLRKALPNCKITPDP